MTLGIDFGPTIQKLLRCIEAFLTGARLMKNNKKDKKIVLNTIPATIILLLLTLVLVLIGYAFLYYRNGYALEDLIDNVVGNL